MFSQASIRELVDLILAEGSNRSAAPIFYVGKELGGAYDDNYLYCGVFTNCDPDGLEIMQDANSDSLPAQAGLVYTCSTAFSDSPFHFVGYRIYKPLSE